MTSIQIFDGNNTIGGNKIYIEEKGHGIFLDFGMDFTECAICKFFHAQGADEFTPFLCSLDFPMSKALGTGLVRTMTLAEGAEKCDFRYKRGREVKQEWPSKVSQTG